MNYKAFLFISIFSFVGCLYAQNKTMSLFDETLSNFEVWIGVPHVSVKGLHVGTYQCNNVHKWSPLGLNNDIKKVFAIEKQNEEIILKVSNKD